MKPTIVGFILFPGFEFVASRLCLLYNYCVWVYPAILNGLLHTKSRNTRYSQVALRKIRINDDPCLTKVCREVTQFDQKLSDLIDDMFETMYDADGVGLAAPQIGILKRIVVIDCSADGSGQIELVNPVITKMDGTQGGMEGCLSFPNQGGYVERANHCVVEGYDRNGDLYEYEAEGLLARAMQHEVDHLNGLTFLRLKTEPPKEYLEQMKKEGLVD